MSDRASGSRRGRGGGSTANRKSEPSHSNTSGGSPKALKTKKDDPKPLAAPEFDGSWAELTELDNGTKTSNGYQLSVPTEDGVLIVGNDWIMSKNKIKHGQLAGELGERDDDRFAAGPWAIGTYVVMESIVLNRRDEGYIREDARDILGFGLCQRVEFRHSQKLAVKGRPEEARNFRDWLAVWIPIGHLHTHPDEARTKLDDPKLRRRTNGWTNVELRKLNFDKHCFLYSKEELVDGMPVLVDDKVQTTNILHLFQRLDIPNMAVWGRPLDASLMCIGGIHDQALVYIENLAENNAENKELLAGHQRRIEERRKAAERHKTRISQTGCRIKFDVASNPPQEPAAAVPKSANKKARDGAGKPKKTPKPESKASKQTPKTPKADPKLRKSTSKEKDPAPKKQKRAAKTTKEGKADKPLKVRGRSSAKYEYELDEPGRFECDPKDWERLAMYWTGGYSAELIAKKLVAMNTRQATQNASTVVRCRYFVGQLLKELFAHEGIEGQVPLFEDAPHTLVELSLSMRRLLHLLRCLKRKKNAGYEHAVAVCQAFPWFWATVAIYFQETSAYFVSTEDRRNGLHNVVDNASGNLDTCMNRKEKAKSEAPKEIDVTELLRSGSLGKKQKRKAPVSDEPTVSEPKPKASRQEIKDMLAGRLSIPGVGHGVGMGKKVLPPKPKQVEQVKYREEMSSNSSDTSSLNTKESSMNASSELIPSKKSQSSTSQSSKLSSTDGEPSFDGDD